MEKTITEILPGYRISGKRYATSRFIFYLANDPRRREVILRAPNSRHIHDADIHLTEREYELLGRIMIPGAIQPYQLEQSAAGPILILEPFNGRLLADVIRECHDKGAGDEKAGPAAERTDPIAVFLTLSIRMAEVIGDVHKHGIVYKNISPESAVWNSETGQVTLIDFSLAESPGSDQRTSKHRSNGFSSLAYLSPEQTGRTRWNVDYRADFYSLGVVFYELLTGRPPFTTGDAVELVHAHIAKTPLPPHEIKPEIPSALSAIVMKLMLKNPDERYQSAFGLEEDLRHCWQQYSTVGTIDEFVVGQSDMVGKLQIPGMLYGRENETAALASAMQKAVDGERQVVLISGESGIGKSRLVEEVYQPVRQVDGYLITGKFDRLKRDIPLAPIIEAFEDLVRHLLVEDEARINQWRKRLHQELGINCRVMIDVIPDLELIVGTFPSLPELTPAESENRFHLAVIRFIRVFADAGRPLIIFLDDLQWVDQASLNLLKLIFQSDEIKHLMFVGAYRHEMVKGAHPLALFMKEAESLKTGIAHIHLTALKDSAVVHLVADALMMSPERAREIGGVVKSKTGGNPFFIIQFLKSLYESGYIRFDRKWEFDLQAIRKLSMTENLAVFMGDRIRKLPATVRSILEAAACIGTRFDLELLAWVCEESEQEVLGALSAAAAEGLVINLEEGMKFAHDRIRDTVYSLMDDRQRVHLHYQIGKSLLARKPQDKLEQYVFEIVNQLNSARDLVQERTERIHAARLNLMAGQRAKASAAYDAARQYLDAGLELLPADPWTEVYELTLALFNESCEVGYLAGDHAHAEKYYAEVMGHARNAMDRIRAFEVKLVMYTVTNNPAAALAIGSEALRQLGVGLPQNAHRGHILWHLIGVKWRLRNKTPEDLLALPGMTDPLKMAIARILMRCTEPSYVESPEHLVLCILILLKLTLRHGNSKYAPFAYAAYAGILGGALGDYQNAFQFGQMSLTALEKLDTGGELKSKVYMMVGGAVHHWVKPLREASPFFLESYKSGLETGDHSFAAYAVNCYLYALFFIGEPLESLKEKFGQFHHAVARMHQESSFQELQVWHRLLHQLTGEGPAVSDILTDTDLEAIIEQWRYVNDLNRLGIYYIGEMIRLYLVDDIPSAISAAQKARPCLDALIGQIFVSQLHFYESLILLDAVEDGSESVRDAYLRRVRKNQKQMKKWMAHAPENFTHQFALVEAGLAAIDGDINAAMAGFDKAIAGASANGFIQDEAIACERAARFWLSLENQDIGGLYLHKAYQAFKRWEADKKVRQIGDQFSALLEAPPQTVRLGGIGEPDGRRVFSAPSDFIDGLDIAAVIRAAQAISEEIELERLLDQLLKLALENAGAQRGVLLLKKEGGDLAPTAAAESTEKKVAVTHSPENGEDSLPSTIVRFVVRTREMVVINDASAESLFEEDPYIRQKQPRSVVCIPVVHQNHLLAVLYLENNLATGIFTPQRMEAVKILASQAAISLDNALLYEHLKAAEKRLRNILTTANEGFLMLDENAVITDVNPEMCRILGRKREAVVGKPYFSMLDERGIEIVLQQLAFRKRGKKGAYDIVFTRPEGTRVECLVKAAPIFDKSGAWAGSFAMVSDITERKRAEAELVDLNRELENRVVKRTAELEDSLKTLKRAQDHLVQSEKMAALGGLVAGVAHEINTPVGIGVTAVSFLEEQMGLLAEKIEDSGLMSDGVAKPLDNAREAAKTIHSNLRRAAELIRSFKEVAVDQSSEERRRFNVKAYMDEILLSLKPKYKRTAHAIEVDCPEEIEVTSYPGAFSQIVTNLVVNSLVHGFDGIEKGTIRISVTTEGNTLNMHYSDDGKGMREETAARIFDPFFTTRRTSGGTGLGMYIVYNLVTQTLGGTISCRSLSGNGTAFEIRIPMDNAS